MPEPHHHLRVKGRRGALDLDLTLALTAPWTVIFGPSGSGKSTLLRAACGLVPSLEVQFRRGDLALQNLPPHRRELAFAPQGGAIFPHLTVRQNIEFGERGKDTSHFIDEAIEVFSLGPLLNRMPPTLSGGERQGVCLARAFAVPGARLMLLDEPFNGIGRTMRDSLLPRMKERMAALGVPVVSVTHDVEEAFLLDAEVVRIDEGVIVTWGRTEDVLGFERERIVRVLRA